MSRAASTADLADVTLLDGLHVVEFSRGYLGQLAGRLFADLGAAVTRVAIPSGPDGPQGILSSYLNYAKNLVEPSRCDCEEWVDGVAKTADVVVIDVDPGEAKFDELRWLTANPNLVVVVVSAFGLTWPFRNWRGGDAVIGAMGGLSTHIGLPGREPLKAPASIAEFFAGLQAVVGGLISVLRGRGGERVDLAAVEAIASLVTGWEAWGAAIGESSPRRSGQHSPDFFPYGLFACRDGFVSLLALQSSEWTRVLEMLGKPEWSTQPRFQDRHTLAVEHIDEVCALVAPWFMERTKWEVFETARSFGVAAVPVCTPEEVTSLPQLLARGYFSRSGPDGETSMPGVPVTANGVRLAPRLGATSMPEKVVGRGNLLRGIRVLDFGWVWAGAITGQIFSDLGADVIKVESLERLDSMRRGRPRIGGEPSPEQNLMFHNTNRGKRSLSMNLKNPESRDVLHELVKSVDIVVENMRPGAMTRLGMDYETLRGFKRDLIYISLPGMGDGPWRDIPVYGPTITALSGLDALTHYGDGLVMGVQFAVVDPAAGLFGAMASLAALWRRRGTGEGVHIEIPLLEVGATMMAPALLPGAPYLEVETLRCRGFDDWLVVEGGPREFAAARRLALRLSAPEAARELQSMGVAAGAVLDASGRLREPYFSVRGTHVSVSQEIFGHALVYDAPWRIANRPAEVRRAGPRLGEHNREIARDLLGFDDSQFEALVRIGVFEKEYGAPGRPSGAMRQGAE